MELHWAAFHELSTCRRDGGPIPWTALQEWTRTLGLTPLEADRFQRLIRRLDVIWMEHQAAEREKRIGKNKTPIGKGRKR